MRHTCKLTVFTCVLAHLCYNMICLNGKGLFFVKKVLSILLVSVVLLAGCEKKPEKYSETMLGLFDTVCSLTGYADDRLIFAHAVSDAQHALNEYHQLFDAYHEYGEMHNLCYLNAHAWEEPVEVPEDLFCLIRACKEKYGSDPRENIAMGAVLLQWHAFFEGGGTELPSDSAIRNALMHIDFDRVILNEECSTVFYEDPGLRLDLGSVAKGYAARETAKKISVYLSDFLLNLGGNIVCRGSCDWKIGVQDPDSQNSICVLRFPDGSAVTSGDYQRYADVNGVRYHHIIDPDTGYPARSMRSLTVVCPDPFEGDYLSTLLFLMSPEEALAYAENAADVEILLIDNAGAMRMTDGMRALLNE